MAEGERTGTRAARVLNNIMRGDKKNRIGTVPEDYLGLVSDAARPGWAGDPASGYLEQDNRVDDSWSGPRPYFSSPETPDNYRYLGTPGETYETVLQKTPLRQPTREE